MDFKGDNLESWFLKRTQDEFYSNKDYIAIYKSYKCFLDNNIHNHIGTVISIHNNDVFLNDHGSSHVKMVINRATMLISNSSIVLSAYEVFLLLMSIQIHDAGHIIKASRKTHACDSKDLFSVLNKYDIETQEKKLIFDIAKVHSGKDDPISTLSKSGFMSNVQVKIQLLAAILRFADELADDKTRASSYLVDINAIPEESKIFHSYSLALDSVSVNTESNEVYLKFYINKNNIETPYCFFEEDKKSSRFLIDEIFSRTLKMYIEAIYFNKFVPPEIKIFSIRVEIEFLDDENIEDFFLPLKYTISERGYPNFDKYNIFDICSEELKCKENSEMRKDGNYYKEQLLKENCDE